MKNFLTIAIILSLNVSFAGYDTLDCTSVDNSYSFSVGNGDQMINFNVKNNNGENVAISKPVILDAYSYNSYNPEIRVTAVGKRTITADFSYTQVITKKNGSTCTGREITDLSFEQIFIISKNDGANLHDGAWKQGALNLSDLNLPGLSDEGYIEMKFKCHNTGATTAGGCYQD